MNGDPSVVARRRLVVAIGLAQLLAWGSSYYLLAIIARPLAEGLSLSGMSVYAAFSAALLMAAALGPWVGGRIDRHGGRAMLMLSNGVFALGLLLLATAQGPFTMLLGWLAIGAAMPMGLYDAAFATLVSLYRTQARRSIVGITLIGGFASTVAWPLSAAVEAQWGWRAVCAMWAVLHLGVGLAIHHFLVPAACVLPVAAVAGSQPPQAPEPAAPSLAVLCLLAMVFTCSGFVFASMATHLPRVLMSVGCTPAAAVAAASLLGAAQVAARLAEAGVFSRWHPLMSAYISTALHPVGALLLAIFAAPFAAVFTILHGAGTGMMTIVKGTLPLALFGATGFGRRAGLLEAPSRIVQAAAPMAYGWALDHYGSGALWLSGGVAFTGFLGVVMVGWISRRP